MPIISMFGGRATLQDRSTVSFAMYWDVKFVKPLSDYKIYVEIENGSQGVFDLAPYLDHGVFRELRNPHYFNRVGIVAGAVTWPHEQDIAPETLISGLRPLDVAEQFHPTRAD